jgi:hypothetical protein
MEQPITQAKPQRKSARTPEELYSKFSSGELTIDSIRQIDAVQLARNVAILTDDRRSWIVMAGVNELRDYIKTAHERGLSFESICYCV